MIHRRSTVLPHLFHILLVLALFARPAAASDAVLYRVFLQDGTAIVSYGEFARVADRVVISIPIGELGPSPKLEIVSIADSAVDWVRTERYAEAVRADLYAKTRGDEDFALLANRVAEALNQIAFTRDPARRLAMAEEARRNLADWPRQNYGYRAGEVAQFVSMLDGVVADLRVAAGQRFSLDFVAMTLPPPPPPLLPAPGFRDTVEHALAAARTTTEAAERIALLQAVSEQLSFRLKAEATQAEATKAEATSAEATNAEATESDAADTDARRWAEDLHARVAADLSAEVRADRDYADLSARTVASADTRARRADVRGLQALIQEVLSADDRFGRRRPQQTASLLAALDLRLDAARRLRLARDAWILRAPILERYKGMVEPVLYELRRSRRWLEDIRELAGPSPYSLERLTARVIGCQRLLARITPPAELEAAHGLLAAAVQLTGHAARTRTNAVSSQDMAVARDASSAAAGALMTFERAADELSRLTSKPVAPKP